MNTKYALSGIKPTGKLHLGNYFGAIKGFLDLQSNDNISNLYFIADYHALNSQPNPQELRKNTIDIFKALISLGLDPEKSIIFIQSDIPEHTELCWLLSGVTPMGLMERAHAYKDSLFNNKSPNMGLFNYPLLQAADILIYNSYYVPVGADQKQHIEMVRDIAEKFNRIYGDSFVIPEPLIQKDSAIILGTDGQKMSKSKNNIISIFGTEKEIKKQIMSIQTASTSLEEPKDFTICPIYNLYKLFATQDEISIMQNNYQNGGYGYGHAKIALYKKLLEYFKSARDKMLELDQNPQLVQKLIINGAFKAKQLARKKIQQIRKTMGIGEFYA